MSSAPASHRYRVEHRTHYDYPQPVSISQQMLHLQPRELPWQRVEHWNLLCEPVPTRERREVDAFGNPVTRLKFRQPHRILSITTQLQVEVAPRPTTSGTGASPSWQALRDSLRFRAGFRPSVAELDAIRYRFRSPIGRAYQRYAQDCFPPGRPVTEAVQALMAKINREFEFDDSATHIATPLAEVLQHRRGVCQDFAHLMLACLRSLDLPCRYVSGYLLTQPPAGQARLIGADASHAWIAVYCGQHGWVEFDPTNNLQPALEHIVLGWGRDLGDVSPLRGVILGAASVAPKVAVTVTPVDTAKIDPQPKR